MHSFAVIWFSDILEVLSLGWRGGVCESKKEKNGVLVVGEKTK